INEEIQPQLKYGNNVRNSTRNIHDKRKTQNRTTYHRIQDAHASTFCNLMKRIEPYSSPEEICFDLFSTSSRKLARATSPGAGEIRGTTQDGAMNSKAVVKFPARAFLSVRYGSSQLAAMNFRIDVWSITS